MNLDIFTLEAKYLTSDLKRIDVRNTVYSPFGSEINLFHINIQGVTVAEDGFISGLITMALIITLTSMGDRVGDIFNPIGNSLISAWATT